MIAPKHFKELTSSGCSQIHLNLDGHILTAADNDLLPILRDHFHAIMYMQCFLVLLLSAGVLSQFLHSDRCRVQNGDCRELCHLSGFCQFAIELVYNNNNNNNTVYLDTLSREETLLWISLYTVSIFICIISLIPYSLALELKHYLLSLWLPQCLLWCISCIEMINVLTR